MVTSKQCMEMFGDPRGNEIKHMMLWDVPTSLEIGVIPKKIYCNKLMVETLERALRALIATGYNSELKTWDGCFNIRQSKGNADVYSLHAWGLAIDVNAAWNGYGKEPTLSKSFVKCFTDNGFDWGGDWRTPDGMHFQLKTLG